MKEELQAIKAATKEENDIIDEEWSRFLGILMRTLGRPVRQEEPKVLNLRLTWFSKYFINKICTDDVVSYHSIRFSVNHDMYVYPCSLLGRLKYMTG